MAMNRNLANAQGIGDFPMRQSNKVAHLGDLRIQGILPGQGIERFVNLQEFLVLNRRGDLCFFQFNPLLAAAAFELAVASGIVHENSAHGFGCRGKEVRAVFKLKTLGAAETEISLVDQGGWLQGVTGAFGSHFLDRDGAQFGINLLIKLVYGLDIPACSIPEQPGHIAHGCACTNRFAAKEHVKKAARRRDKKKCEWPDSFCGRMTLVLPTGIPTGQKRSQRRVRAVKNKKTTQSHI